MDEWKVQEIKHGNNVLVKLKINDIVMEFKYSDRTDVIPFSSNLRVDLIMKGKDSDLRYCERILILLDDYKKNNLKDKI